MAEGEKLAPLIAVVGADGAGKSRLSADLLEHICRHRSAEAGYLGEGSSVTSRKIGRWPLVGPLLVNAFQGVACQLRDADAPIPGLIAASYALHRSRRRYLRFQKLVEKRRRGIVIVTDRYPQVECPGLHDGPILAGVATNQMLAGIKAEERALYAQMAAHVPTLVIRLQIDIDTAMRRKPDHDPSLVAMKIASLPAITFNSAPILDLDSTMDYGEELARAEAAVSAALANAN